MNTITIVGITGRSGSGKSSVSSYYTSLGYPVCDGDALSREIATPGSACVQELEQAFGSEIIGADGSLLRRKLADIAFSTPTTTKLLNRIVHPFIMEELQNRVNRAEESGNELFFLDGAAIVGTPFQPYCNKLIVVVTEYKLSISRIILRDNISKTAAKKRLDAQISEEKLRDAADYIIENNVGIATLEKRASDVLQQLLRQRR